MHPKPIKPRGEGIQNKERGRDKLVDKSIKNVLRVTLRLPPQFRMRWIFLIDYISSHPLHKRLCRLQLFHILHSLKFAIEQFHYHDFVVLLHFSANIEDMRGMPSQNLLNFVMVTETHAQQLYLLVLHREKKTKLYKTR